MNVWSRPRRFAIEVLRERLTYRTPEGRQLSTILISRDDAERIVEEWDELLSGSERPGRAAHFFSFAVLLAMLLGILIGILLAITSAHAKIACSASPPDTDKYYAWRVIDGRKCYYIGEKGMDKDNLFWPKPKPIVPPPMPPPSDQAKQIESTRALEPKPRRWHRLAMVEPPPAVVTITDDELLEYCCWPELTEEDRRRFLVHEQPPREWNLTSWLAVFLPLLAFICYSTALVLERKRPRQSIGTPTAEA